MTRTPMCVVLVGLVTTVASAQNDAPVSVQKQLESAAMQIKSDPREALDTLQKLESVEPGNPWLWYYRGLAQARLGNWYESLDSYDRASDLLTRYGDPDLALAESVRAARRAARSQVFSFSIRTGLAYDGNVTFLGDGGAGVDLIAGEGDARFMSGMNFTYAPVATHQERLSFTARLNHSWHFRIDEFDYQAYGASIRYERFLSRRWTAAIQYDYDISYLGNDSFLSAHAITPSLEYAWVTEGRRFAPSRTTLAYQIESRDFLFPTTAEFDRDGVAHAVGIDQRYAWQPTDDPTWVWEIVTGYTFQSFATEGTEFDRLVHDFRLGFEIPFKNPLLDNKDLIARFNANWQIGDYRETSLFDRNRDDRSDLITTLDLILSQDLIEDPKLGDLTVHTIVSWTDAHSNIWTRDFTRPFTYEKWLAGIQFEWSW